MAMKTTFVDQSFILEGLDALSTELAGCLNLVSLPLY